jgi:hypothetical protein
MCRKMFGGHMNNQLNAIGSVVFLGLGVFLFAPKFGGENTFKSQVVSAASILQDEVYKVAKLQPQPARSAVASAAFHCADGFDDIYNNAETPVVMSRIYAELINKVIATKDRQSKSTEIDHAARDAIRSMFLHYKSVGVTENDNEYRALGMINIHFDTYNSCVYRESAQVLQAKL